MGTRTTNRRARWCAASIAVLALAAGAARAEPARTISVAAGSLESALNSLAAQAHVQLVYAPELVRGRRAAALAGRFTPEEAVRRLVHDDAIVVSRAGPEVLVLKPRPSPSRTTAQEDPPARPFGDEAAQTPLATSAAIDAAPPAEVSAATVTELQVTGTHIRGTTPAASPLIVLDRNDLDRLGRATLAEALQTLPQNVSSQNTEGTLSTRSDITGTNANFATGLNLRGMGSGATLVLVNGRRVAGSGTKADFVDLSLIPSVAVERVEILTDGASAIYGSDAVAGVVNVILRDGFDGGELRLRGGAATAGEPWEAQAGLILGRRWAGGHATIAWEAGRRTALNADDRSFLRNADLTSRGGHDWREYYAYPGNLEREGVPYWGIPAGQDGTHLAPGDLRPGDINLQNPNQGGDMLPDQRTQSVWLSAGQDLGERLHVSSDLRYSFRKARARQIPGIGVFAVTPANPWFVSPDGSDLQVVYYSFAEDVPNALLLLGAESWTGTIAADLELGGDWRASAYLAYAREADRSDTWGSTNTYLLDEALGNIPDDPATAYSPARDGYFNPFTGRPGNNDAVTRAIRSGFTVDRLTDEVRTASLQADGSLFDIPGGPLKAAIGLQARREDFEEHGSSFYSTPSPVPLTTYDTDRSVVAAFAELRAPLVGSANARPGVRALELSLALRGERYSDFGHTYNPKAGLVWSPAAGLRLRGSYGRSFRAPALRDLAALPISYASTLRYQGSPMPVLLRSGGNPDLGPERASSWTLGGDWTPPSLSGLRISATWFEARFRDRIDRPAARNIITVLEDARFAQFVQRIDPAHSPADLALIRDYLSRPETRATTVPPERFGAIVDIRLSNTGMLEVGGIDLSARYETAGLGGRLAFGAEATRLTRYSQKLTPTSPAVDFIGQITWPARVKSRLSVDWTRGAFGAGLALNQQSGFSDPSGAHVDGPETFDVQLRAGGPEHTPLAGLRLALTVRNLTDARPPFYDNPVGLAYDPASGDPIGRFVALQLTRAW